ncbi:MULTISPECIES: DUF4350 domain-containing protein [unclassified Pedobacter]|uniref:DUF4350 domain-containing protein n=1 Tax=unclassified Pedobacter TaxID=2628915 RepID=UPI0014236427|nr:MULTISPECIES: DUF4350 domain-containing protein [unclassified Pedobacter]NII84640.1 hypothetical protein [Pedobacter sp. SG908]NMN38446.1 hypothetical protein [Pedobacter sp. SG918]
MKGYKLYLIIGSILILGYLIAQYNKPTPTNWAPTYATKDKIPYGTYILYNRIKDILPSASIQQSKTAVYTTLKSKKFNKAAYIIVAQKTDISKTDLEQLIKYMHTGNDVFIATYDLGKISKELKIQTSTTMSPEGSTLNFTNPELKTDANYGFERGIGSQYFSKVDTSKTTILGINADNKPNFIRYTYGKGNLYLIAEPGFYTNFNLLNKYGAEYAAKTLSYLHGNKQLIFDEYFSAQKNTTTDMLRVFFKHPELKFAYYLAIFSLIIFVLYDIKRRQRIIPIADPLTNSSLAFVNVVGSVYYHERNNLDIALKKINYFMEYLRSRYYLKTNDIDSKFAQVLMEKTGINEALAKTLTKHFIQTPTMGDLSDTQLINLNESIEQFYKNTQSNGTRTV